LKDQGKPQVKRVDLASARERPVSPRCFLQVLPRLQHEKPWPEEFRPLEQIGKSMLLYYFPPRWELHGTRRPGGRC
jgi:hypothetical protein